MSKEISEIYRIYDLILSNKEIIGEQEKPKVTNMFGGAEVSIDNTNTGVTPPSGWTKGVKYILKNGGSIYSPISGKILDVGNLSNTGNRYLYLETKEKNQIYIGNLISISVQKNQSINIGDKLGESGKGSYIYVSSKNSSVNDIVTTSGDFDFGSSNRYNPSGSKTGDYMASKISSQFKEGINEQRRGRGGKKFGNNETTMLEPVPISPGFKGNFGEPRSYGPHPGTDIGAIVGTPVISPMDGLVEVANFEFNDECGATIDINYGNGFWSRFCHLSKINVSEGDFVIRGQVVGLTGGKIGAPGAGNTEGPHLHWSLKKNNETIDPIKYVGTVVGPYAGPSSTNTQDSDLKKRAEKVLEEVKSKLDLSNLSPEEKKKILDKLTIGAITTAMLAGGVALYKLLSTVLSGIKTATTDTNTSQRYNPSGSKLGEYIGDVIKFVLPG
jgi:murein DD-endopeptidase MepM/ murein hydrolase activator NlpD